MRLFWVIFKQCAHVRHKASVGLRHSQSWPLSLWNDTDGRLSGTWSITRRQANSSPGLPSLGRSSLDSTSFTTVSWPLFGLPCSWFSSPLSRITNQSKFCLSLDFKIGKSELRKKRRICEAWHQRARCQVCWQPELSHRVRWIMTTKLTGGRPQI